MSIIDQFSKYGYNYILSHKNAELILGKLSEFINNIGKPRKIHTDNGKEFHNKLFESYRLKNNIIQIFGRPYHPQSQG